MKISESFIRGLPKAELHLHIEGTLEPEMLFELARKNKVRIRYQSVEELKSAYDFSSLQDFLDIYYEGTHVLIEEQDFYDLTRAYLKKAHDQSVFHTEIFFDPQSHVSRGIPVENVIGGISRALEDARAVFGISSRMIISFLRHLDESDAMLTYEKALPFRDKISAIGLDSSEKGNPPSKFRKLFERARKEGFLTVAHAGEEGPAGYVREAIDILKVVRVDHGNHSVDDEKLVDYLIKNQIPLTMCPLSNFRLKVLHNLKEHPLKRMLDRGVLVTVNSDDPAYFGGYINENYLQLAEALDLSIPDFLQLAKNSFSASFLDKDVKLKMHQKVDEYFQSWNNNADKSGSDEK
jgi:adenine deaminase